MPVWNSERYLKTSIDSMLSQTYENFEIICLNDGSTDNSLEIVGRYRKRDSRVKILNFRKIGLTKVLNAGLDHAKGEYIARMDTDDISTSDRIQKQITFLKENPSIFLVATSGYLINKNGARIGTFSGPQTSSQIAHTMENENVLYHPSIMFRSISKYYYREKLLFAEDYDLFLRMITDNKKIHILRDKLLYYRIQKDSVSQQNAVVQEMFAMKAREFYRQRKQYGIDSYEEFNTQEILDIDINSSVMTSVLKAQLKYAMKSESKRTYNNIITKHIRLRKLSRYLFISFFLMILPLSLQNRLKNIRRSLIN